ncbi:hypothetical protein MMC07_006195 [Pseudocyphellaria aurata]|nr:hypothetical protein [Pseudocyphellaria aurata]
MNPLLPLLYLAFHDFSVTAFPQDPNNINTGSFGDFFISSASPVDNSQSDSNTPSNALVSPVIQNSAVTVPVDYTSLMSSLPPFVPNNFVPPDTDAPPNAADTTFHDAYDIAGDSDKIPQPPQAPKPKYRLPNDCMFGVLACCLDSFE